MLWRNKGPSGAAKSLWFLLKNALFHVPQCPPRVAERHAPTLRRVTHEPCPLPGNRSRARSGTDVGAHACSHLLEGQTLWQLALISSGGRPPAPGDASAGTEVAQGRDMAAAVAGAVLLRAVSHPRYGLWEPLGRHSASSTLRVAPVRAACVPPHGVSRKSCESAAGVLHMHRAAFALAVAEALIGLEMLMRCPSMAIRGVLHGCMLNMISLHSSLVWSYVVCYRVLVVPGWLRRCHTERQVGCNHTKKTQPTLRDCLIRRMPSLRSHEKMSYSNHDITAAESTALSPVSVNSPSHAGIAGCKIRCPMLQVGSSAAREGPGEMLQRLSWPMERPTQRWCSQPGCHHAAQLVFWNAVLEPSGLRRRLYWVLRPHPPASPPSSMRVRQLCQSIPVCMQWLCSAHTLRCRLRLRLPLHCTTALPWSIRCAAGSCLNYAEAG